MYVRWLTYQSKSTARRRQDKRLTAIIVESVRVNGKPRQRHIASLASIRESQIDDDVSRRCRFWETVTVKLDGLSDKVTADDRRQIEAALAAHVPIPTRKQYDDWKRECVAILGPKWVMPAIAHWPR